MKARVLALGLDALSPDLLEAWAGDGTLPNLAALMERGLTGRVRAVEHFYVGSTWPSFYTARTPDNHGMHYELQLVPGTYDLQRVQHSEFVHGEPLWSALSRQGRRVAALDVPLSRPTNDVNGVQVVDWGGHDAFFGFHASPPEFGKRLIERWGTHPHGGSCDVRRQGLEDYREFIQRMEAAISVKVGWTRELLDRGEWDLFLQVFTEAHCVGHQCWHLHDPSHPAHDPKIAAVLGDPVRRIYQALDRALGELIEDVGDGRILVWSGHGMSFWRGASFMLPEILVRLGVCRPPAASHSTDSRRLGRVAEAAWKRLPPAAKRPVRRMRARRRRRSAARSRPLPVPRIRADAAASLCFPSHNGSAVAGIRLNLAGRESAGRLQPGREADEFCARLTADLLEIVDERTGGPLVQRVTRTSDVYRGDYVDLLPDLLVEWSDDVPTGSTIVGDGVGARVRISSPRIGTLEGVNHFGRTGGHRPWGWFITAGQGIEGGRLERDVSVLDLAPSIAALLNAEMDDVDGRAVPEISAARSSEGRRTGVLR